MAVVVRDLVDFPAFGLGELRERLGDGGVVGGGAEDPAQLSNSEFCVHGSARRRIGTAVDTFSTI